MQEHPWLKDAVERPALAAVGRDKQLAPRLAHMRVCAFE